MEIQKPSLLYVSVNTNKTMMQAQIGQNVELPGAKSESEPDTKNVKMGQLQQMQLSVDMANDKESAKLIDPPNTHLSFTIDKDTNETIISIIDDKSGEIIRQIPSDEISNMKKRMMEIHGLLFDIKA